MTATYDSLTFERIGHASVRIVTDDGVVAYVDPWSEVLTGEPGDADYVFLTHDDADHYDPDAVDAVAGADVTVVAFDGIDTAALSADVVEVSESDDVALDDLDARTVPAYNAADGPHVDEDGVPFHAAGDGVGFVFEFPDAEVVYVGDSDYLPHHDGLSPDVTIVPIGGHFTMDRHEAADLLASQQPELALPVHYDTFEAIETDESAFRDDVEALGIRVELF